MTTARRENDNARRLRLRLSTEVRAKADGDVHIALQDATGDKVGIVVVELPAKPRWCARCRAVVRFNRDNGTQAH